VKVETDGVASLSLNLRPLTEIGSVSTTNHKGPASAPISVNTLTRTQIQAMPQNQSLNRLIETMPGIVQFSYDEPIAHGFHGLTYEIDGIPVPEGTAANFSAVVDPRSLDSLEVYTGAIPAEFGGERQGAVVNIISDRPTKLDRTEAGALTLGIGSYGDTQTSLSEVAQIGPKTELFYNGNLERSNRGLDSPTVDPIHDRAHQENHFLRTMTELGGHATLDFNLLDNVAKYQVPINVNPNDPNDPVSSPLATDDVQTEHDQLVSLAYTKTAANGTSFTRIAPWVRSNRVQYLGDTANELAGVLNNGDGTASPLNSLRQDRRSLFTGLRIEHFHFVGEHALQAGIDSSLENFNGTEQIGYFDTGNALQAFQDNRAQRGSNTGAYVQDKWLPTKFVSIFGGLRYDRSTGYVSGGQLSPRLEINGQVGAKDILHGYYGREYAAPFLEDTRLAAVVLSGNSTTALPTYDLKPERDSYYELGLAHTMSPLSRWYLNFWKRDVDNVLDTTSLAQTPIQAVFNNTIGVAKGAELRIEAKSRTGDSASLSASVSQSLAGGVNGGTFLFCPPGSGASCSVSNHDLTLQPEDHDQTVAIKGNLTKRLGSDRTSFASLAPEYGTGYPVEFQNGEGRLLPHLTFDVALGRDPGQGPSGRVGYNFTIGNLFNRPYLIKVNNGFNTTQWSSSFRADLRITKPF
jgi:outer membrane receptor for ferrienterochelin and colicin